jgi:hypothetical protein
MVRGDRLRRPQTGGGERIAIVRSRPQLRSEMGDETILARINALAHEEEELWSRAGDGGGMSDDERSRLGEIGVELDRCYDLLHQRQARRAAGLDPDEAQLRPADVVERYQQ